MLRISLFALALCYIYVLPAGALNADQSTDSGEALLQALSQLDETDWDENTDWKIADFGQEHERVEIGIPKGWNVDREGGDNGKITYILAPLPAYDLIQEQQIRISYAPWDSAADAPTAFDVNADLYRELEDHCKAIGFPNSRMTQSRTAVADGTTSCAGQSETTGLRVWEVKRVVTHQGTAGFYTIIRTLKGHEVLDKDDAWGQQVYGTEGRPHGFAASLHPLLWMVLLGEHIQVCDPGLPRVRPCDRN